MATCKIMGNDVKWPCALSRCSLFGDCLAEYRGSLPKRCLTNADRIRSMSDEELAEWLTEFSSEAFAAGVFKIAASIMTKKDRLSWLQQSAEEEKINRPG